jgi:hypothetical protein
MELLERRHESFDRAKGLCECGVLLRRDGVQGRGVSAPRFERLASGMRVESRRGDEGSALLAVGEGADFGEPRVDAIDGFAKNAIQATRLGLEGIGFVHAACSYEGGTGASVSRRRVEHPHLFLKKNDGWMAKGGLQGGGAENRFA